MSLKILVNNSYIELEADSITVPLTFSVADMKQPDKRKTSSSKTIKLKGTQTNLNVLRNVYSLPMSNLDTPLVFTFDPRTRIEVIYEENGIVIFDGLFQVLKAIRVGEVFEFECLLFSNIANVISTLGDLKLSDLDFSEYQHELGKQVIRDSFDATVIQNGVATSNFTAGVPDGFGYIYGWFDMGFDTNYTSNSPRFQRTNQIPLGVYFKEVLSKMMQHIEQPYTFTLDNTELWKRLTLFNEGGIIAQVSQDDLDLRAVDVDYVADTFTQSGPFTVLKPLIVSVINTDDLDQVNGTNIEIAQTGNYLFNFDGSIDFLVSSSFFLVQIDVEFLVNGSLVSTIFSTGNINNVNPSPIVYATTTETQLNAGDIVTARMRISVNQGGNSSFELLAGSYATVMIGLDAPLLDGGTVDVVRYLPKMKCADFYKSIMRMFNLYQQDQEDGILIIPAIDYYQGSNSNETEDWSDKLDYSQPIEIEPPNRIEGKNYVFKYATETDDYHNDYLQEFGSNYGDFTFTVPNTWQVGNNVLEIGFALGIPVRIDETAVIMPTIYTFNNGVINPYKGKAPRIHVYNGLRTIPNEDFCSINPSDNTVDDPLDISVGGVMKYPEFHHMLNPAAPTFEIAFQAPQRLYYTGGQITNANLFNTYWDRFIREITSADAKILTAYFKLSRMGIYNLNFRSLKNIDGVVYRLNIVSDYMGAEQTTKCELIKIIEGQSRRVSVQSSDVLINALNTNPNPIIIIGGETLPADLKAGQMGYDAAVKIFYINTGQGLIQFRT